MFVLCNIVNTSFVGAVCYFLFIIVVMFDCVNCEIKKRMSLVKISVSAFV